MLEPLLPIVLRGGGTAFIAPGAVAAIVEARTGPAGTLIHVRGVPDALRTEEPAAGLAERVRLALGGAP